MVSISRMQCVSFEHVRSRFVLFATQRVRTVHGIEPRQRFENSTNLVAVSSADVTDKARVTLRMRIILPLVCLVNLCE
jgi:hypothetical protein